jgi:hypothetical protein
MEFFCKQVHLKGKDLRRLETDSIFILCWTQLCQVCEKDYRTCTHIVSIKYIYSLRDPRENFLYKGIDYNVEKCLAN